MSSSTISARRDGPHGPRLRGPEGRSTRASSSPSAPATAWKGPYLEKGGQDVLAQAMSGAMHRRADPSIPLSIYPTALADYAAGMHMVQGILLALLQREKTGEGQRISVSLYNSMLAMQMQEAASLLMRDNELNWAAMPLSGVFKTTDGAIVMVGAFKENPLRDICNALEIEDLSKEERFSDIDHQREHRSELQALFHEHFAKASTAHWVERLEGVDILCAPVKSLAEALNDPQTAINNMILEAAPTKERPGEAGGLADRHVRSAGDRPSSTAEPRRPYR